MVSSFQKIVRSVEVNGTVIKTSVGTAEKMKIVRVSNLVNTMKICKEKIILN